MRPARAVRTVRSSGLNPRGRSKPRMQEPTGRPEAISGRNARAPECASSGRSGYVRPSCSIDSKNSARPVVSVSTPGTRSSRATPSKGSRKPGGKPVSQARYNRRSLSR